LGILGIRVSLLVLILCHLLILILDCNFRDLDCNLSHNVLNHLLILSHLVLNSDTAGGAAVFGSAPAAGGGAAAAVEPTAVEKKVLILILSFMILILYEIV
jgi:hypothetical protein